MLFPAAVFAACAFAGWLATRSSSSAALAGDSTAATKATKTDRAPTKAAMPSEVLAMLAPIRTAKDTEESLRATIQLASNIPVADIEKWLSAGWFEGAGDMQLSLFTRTLLSRWQEEDPGAMLKFCLRKEIRITYEFAGEWARRDPAAALECIEQEKNPTLRSNLMAYMGEALTKSDPRVAISHINDLYSAMGQDGQYQVAGMIRGLAASAPDLLKEESAKWPKVLQDLAKNSIASAALKKNFAKGLADLSRQEGGKRLFIQTAGSDSALMKNISRDPASLPPGWLHDMVGNGNSATYYLVQDDPMKWLDANMDFEALGLDARQQQNIRNYAFSQLGSKHPEKLKALIAGGSLDDDERRNAIGVLASNMKSEEAGSWIATLNEADRQIAEQLTSHEESQAERPVTPTTLLEDLAAAKQLNWTQSRAMANWGREQMQAFESAFDALPSEQKGQIAAKFLNNQDSEVPSEFNAKVVSYLLANPGSASKAPETAPDEGVRQADPLAMAACNIASRWGLEDPAAAGNWIKGLPAGDARTWAARNLAVQWAEYDPSAARRWAAGMPATERAAVEKALQNRNAD